MKIALLILFSPLALASWLVIMLTVMLVWLVGRIPFVGSSIGIILFAILVPLYPVVTLYGLNFQSLFREKIKIDDNGFSIQSRAQERYVEWVEIKRLYRYFTPPGFSYGIELKSGYKFTLNRFSSAEQLVAEICGREIEFDESYDFGRSA